MKIEKLTENKIRVIVNVEDLEQSHTDLHSLMTTSLENQGLFLNILAKAEKEVGFNTENCKLLIEAFSTPDGTFVFTITKYKSIESTDNSSNNFSQRKLTVKRKSVNLKKSNVIYSFNDFHEFCNFCSCINSFKNFDVNKFSKNISLYLYNNTYYLIIDNINLSYEHINIFYSIISEFAKIISNSDGFKNKLLDHGDVIIKKNAINVGIKYFSE